MRLDLHLSLRSDTSAEQAIEALTARIITAKNLPGSVARGGFSDEAEAVYLKRRQADYIDWVEVTEGQLGNVTNDPEVLTLLYTPAYYEIRQLDPSSPRAVAFIDAERARQASALEALRDDLQRRLERARAAPGAITVLDTNALLHHQLPDSVAWREIVGQESIRLVIPLRVIEELDAKKYTESSKLRQRARERLPKLYALVGSGGAPKALPNGHGTLEVFIEPGPRTRAADADTEILETARDLERLSGSKVMIVTGDTAMRLRAETEGIATAAMPISDVAAALADGGVSRSRSVPVPDLS
jgi:rRNA-processing protein FCF1